MLRNNEFFQRQAFNLLSHEGKLETPIVEDPNKAAGGSPDYILFKYYVMSSKHPKKNRIMIEEGDVLQDCKNVIDILKKFEQDNTKDELFIAINVHSQHAVYLHARKTNDDKIELLYTDPYGDKSPYGNPPKVFKKALDEFGNTMRLLATKESQQVNSSNCFAITYQNMIDRYEEKSEPTIKNAKENKEDENTIKDIRLKMKQDMSWLYDKYYDIKKEVNNFIQQQFPEESKERIELERKFSLPQYDEEGDRVFETYDPTDYRGHQQMVDAEKDKCINLLSRIDFSEAPSQKPPQLNSEVPQDVKKFVEEQGYKIEIITSMGDPNKVIGYSIDISHLPIGEEQDKIANQIDKALPKSVRDNVLYIIEKKGAQKEQEKEETPTRRPSM